MMPYSLRDMFLAHYYKMLRKYRIWIELYIVGPTLAPFKRKVKLLLWPIICTEETRTL